MSTCDLLRLQQSSDTMGATFSIILYGHDRDELESAVNAAFDEARRLDEMLSNYRPASEWSLVNRHAAQRPVPVSAELFQILSYLLNASRETEGAFDITMGPLKRAWGFFRGNGRIPDAEELAAARRNVGYQYIQLDEVHRTVRFDHDGVEIDPGGFGKGYAVDRITGILKERGLDTALLTASGSSLYGLGAPPKEPKGWRADIRDPEHSRKSIAHCFLNDMALSTSGTGEKFFWSEEGMISHLVDPRTGQALQEISQVSVVCPRAVDGEVWAKAYLINGREWASKHRHDDFRVLFSSGEPSQPSVWF
jgi:FAD:protein FMN transferase